MNHLKIDIKKSIEHQELKFKKSILEKLWQHCLIPLNLLFFLYVSGCYFYEDLFKNESFTISLLAFIFVIVISILYLIVVNKNVYSSERKRFFLRTKL